jgi:hypothetical protein
MQIVGENSYQKNIREIVFYKEMVDRNDLDYKVTNITATLILENDNKYDMGNAVRVDVDGLTVGYLAKEDARKYRKELNRIGLTDELCTCRASAYGKREDFGRMMKFGIWLSIDLDNLEVGEKPRKKLFGIF